MTSRNVGSPEKGKALSAPSYQVVTVGQGLPSVQATAPSISPRMPPIQTTAATRNQSKLRPTPAFTSSKPFPASKASARLINNPQRAGARKKENPGKRQSQR